MKWGANPRKINKWGELPIHLAESPGIVNVLLEKRSLADTCFEKDKRTEWVTFKFGGISNFCFALFYGGLFAKIFLKSTVFF